jgi:tetratricopeptide (TPR) repeat protein
MASKVVLNASIPGNWVIDDIGGQNDFGFDFQVYVDVDGGVQHTFFIQLKGTEKLDLVNDGQELAFRMKRRTLNLFANTLADVMLAVAEVKLSPSGKAVPAESTIHWAWISDQLRVKRGGPHELDLSDTETQTVHLVIGQLIHEDLRIEPHLQARQQLVKAAVSLEDILRQNKRIGGSSRHPALGRLLSAAQARPDELATFVLGAESGSTAAWPPEALEIRALLRAGSTAQAEQALAKLGEVGFGSTPFLRALFISQRAKTRMQRGRQDEAIALFEEAYAIDTTEENLIPLAELRILHAIDRNDMDAVRDTLELLSGAESKDGLSLRVRGYVSIQALDEAELCLQRITDSKQTLARVVLLAGQRKFDELLELAVAAELDTELSRADLTSVQLVAARAVWSGATENVILLNESNELPLSGAIGTDLDLAEKAWSMAQKCLDGLRDAGWPPNTGVLAPVLCGLAGLLGKEGEAIRLLGDAPATRPEYVDLQHNFELLAIGAEETELALAANRRQPEKMEVLVRRTNLLFELRCFDECQAMALKVARWEGEQHKNSPLALSIGYAAAHKAGRHAEAREIHEVLEAQSAWAPFIPFAEFVRRGILGITDPPPIDALREGSRTHPDAWLLAANLFLNLNVNEPELAREAVELAKKLKSRALLSLNDTQRLVAAHSTLAQWQEAANVAADGLVRFKGDERLLATAAVAEEMMGHTGKAIQMLETVVEAGTSRIPNVHNFMGLAFRLGRMDSVRKAIDRLLELESGPKERLELLRLSALVYFKQGEHAKAHETAKGLGDLVDQDDEEEEGILVNLVMAVTITGPTPDDQFIEWAKRRVDWFCSRWPESRLFRRVSLPEHGLEDIDDLHDVFESIGGNSRERLAGFEAREQRVKSGELPVPFILRPDFVFHYIGDPFTLWEAAKASRYGDHQFHLVIVSQVKEEKSPDATRDIPLLDLTALLVVDSLGLFDALFSVFKKIAISKATVGYISQQANGVLARGVGAETAARILNQVNRWVTKIDQPGSSSAPKREDLTPLHAMREYVELAKERSYLAYCDDAILRAMIHADNAAVRFCTSLETMEILDKRGELEPSEVSLKLTSLVDWHVGISVTDRYLIASLEGAAPAGFAGGAAQLYKCFIAHKPFITLVRAIWDSAKSTNDLIAHMGNLLRSMMLGEGSNTDAVAAVLACWFGRVRFLQQNDGLGWMLICYPVLLALQGLPRDTGCRFVSILQQAVQICVGERAMSQDIEKQVVRELGTIVGRIAHNIPRVGSEILATLQIALPTKTVAGDIFAAAYTAGYVQASASYKN